MKSGLDLRLSSLRQDRSHALSDSIGGRDRGRGGGGERPGGAERVIVFVGGFIRVVGCDSVGVFVIEPGLSDQARRAGAADPA